MVNGEVLTADISTVNVLSINNTFLIYDLTGIENFSALSDLDISNTDLYTQTGSTTNQVLDLSNNTNFEFLQMFWQDDNITNFVSSIDLRTNPLIAEINVAGNWMLNEIDLRSGTTDVSNLNIDISIADSGATDPESDFCIRVTDEAASNSRQGVYSTWTINADNNPYFFSETCTLGTEQFNVKTVSIYPNPGTNRVEIRSDLNATSRIGLYSALGKKINTFQDFTSEKKATISIQELTKWMYLLKIFDQKNKSITKKIMKKV